MVPDLQIPLTGVYTTTQAAKLLGISRPTLRKYAEKGMLRKRLRQTTGGNYRAVYEGRALMALWKAKG